MKEALKRTSFALALGLPTALLAADFAAMDADGDGYVSMAEFQEAMPGVSADAFMSADANADGALTEAEIAAAQDAGTLPPSEG